MRLVGFQSTTTVFDRAKTAHALDSAALEFGEASFYCPQNSLL
jgi:hypothetical protein